MINRNKIALTVFVFLSLFIILFPDKGFIYQFGKTPESEILNGGLINEPESSDNSISVFAEVSIVVIVLLFCLQFSIFIQAFYRLLHKKLNGNFNRKNDLKQNEDSNNITVE